VLSSTSRFFIGSLIASLASWSAHAALPVVAPSQQEFPNCNDQPRAPQYCSDQPDFGSDVDMYGNVAIVGVPNANGYAGRAAIFVRDAGGHWNRTANLVANDASPNALFGARVALLEGKAVVASKNAIYLFVRQSNGAWQQKDERTFAGAASVSDLDWQGNLLVVGVPGDTYPNYAFAYDTSQTNTLRKIGRFAPADAVKTDGFGTRVAAYGSAVVVTAPGYNNHQGAAYVYNCGATACTQNQKILAIDGSPGDSFGSSVDMNGTYLVIGAQSADRSGSAGAQQGGSAYVFTRSGNAWAQVQTLHPTADEAKNYASFGNELTIQGSRLLVSSSYNGVYYPGLVFEYALQGSQWSARALLKFDVGGFGTSTSLIGSYAIIGTPLTEEEHGSSEVDFYTLP